MLAAIKRVLRKNLGIVLCCLLHVTVISVSSNCTFPFTYNGGLYYSCIENIAGVSTDEQPLACINDKAIPVVCDSPGWSGHVKLIIIGVYV